VLEPDNDDDDDDDDDIDNNIKTDGSNNIIVPPFEARNRTYQQALQVLYLYLLNLNTIQ